jgi:hypothetical protein
MPGVTEKNHVIRQDSRSTGRNLNPGPPEYEAGVLTTRPRRSMPVKQDWRSEEQINSMPTQHRQLPRLDSYVNHGPVNTSTRFLLERDISRSRVSGQGGCG